MNDEIKALIQAAVQGRLPEMLKSHKPTPELAASVRKVFLQAIHNDAPTAMAAAAVAVGASL